VRVHFGSTAPDGRARLTVRRGRKRIATGRVTVRRLRTVTKKLRLNRAGRRAIRPGKRRRVTLELKLPNGEKVKRTLTLKRKRR
jgi:hypothetical protein